MEIKKALISTLLYTAVTFTIAVVWHVLLFKSTYLEFGYFEGEPNFLYGLLSIILQGFILSIFYPFVKLNGTNLTRSLKYSFSFGAFLWSSHVLGFAAKQDIANELFFMGMESFYLCIQFLLFGLVLFYVYREK
jgi:hypothetical protein